MASKKKAEVQLSVDDRSFKQKLADASKRWGKFGKSLGKGVSGGFGKVLGGGLKTAGKLGALAGFAGAGALVGSEISKTMEFEEALTRLKIASRGTLGGLDAFRSKVFAISGETGLAREQVLAGASAYVTLTGDTKTAASSMELFAKIQRATGASMEDIAASAAALSQNLKIKPEEFEKAFSILIAGGKAGSVELRDMAGLMAGLAPLAERFAGGSGTKGLADLGASLQLTRQGFGTAEEAATGLSSLMGAIVQHADRLEAANIKVFDKDAKGVKHLRNFQQIVEAISRSKLAKDPMALTKALGRKEALAAYIQLTKVRGAWDDLAMSTMGATDVSKDYAEYQASAAGRMSKLWNDLKNMIAAAFTPERIEAFVASIGKAVEIAGALFNILRDAVEFLDQLTDIDNIATGSLFDKEIANNVRDVATGKMRIEDVKEPFRALVQEKVNARNSRSAASHAKAAASNIASWTRAAEGPSLMELDASMAEDARDRLRPEGGGVLKVSVGIKKGNLTAALKEDRGPLVGVAP